MGFDAKSDSQALLPKRLLSTLLLYGLAAAIGCAMVLIAETIMPFWMALKPRPSTVGAMFMHRALANWLIFMLLYVPDVLTLLLGGFSAGLYVRPRTLSWLSTCVLFYAAFVPVRGGGPWWYALGALQQGALRDSFFWGSMAVIIFASPYLGARMAMRFRPPPEKPGVCKKCRYSLYGLRSTICPECGTPFALADAKDCAEPTTDSSEPSSLRRAYDRLLETRVASHILWFRVGLLGVAVGLFYGMDWMWLRVAQRDIVAWSVRASGYDPMLLDYEGSPAFRVEGRVHYYTPECTYVDLMMMVAPFLWVVRARHWRNILRIGIAVLVILSGNLIRCWAAVYLGLLGFDRFYAHDLPDYVIWWPTVVVVVVLGLGRDVGKRFGSRRIDAIVAPAGMRTGDAQA